MITTEHKIIRSFDETLISYQVTGKGPALFLLHGNGGSSQYFQYQINFFSQFYQVFAIDSRDHGQSTNNADYLSFQQMSKDLFTIIQKENLTSIYILGFSDGANLALAFAGNYPQYVKKMILNAPNIYNHGVKRFSFYITYLAYYALRSVKFLSTHFGRFTRLLSLLTKEPDIPIETIKKIECPCLLIIGSKDAITEEHIREIAEILPNPEVQIVYGGRHTLSKQHPALFNHIVFDFLQSTQNKNECQNKN